LSGVDDDWREGFTSSVYTNDVGVRSAVILPIEDFQELLEDLECLAIVAERRDEPTLSHEELLAELQAMASCNIIWKHSAAKELKKLLPTSSGAFVGGLNVWLRTHLPVGVRKTRGF
jgi:hypothetical protein